MKKLLTSTCLSGLCAVFLLLSVLMVLWCDVNQRLTGLSHLWYLQQFISSVLFKGLLFLALQAFNVLLPGTDTWLWESSQIQLENVLSYREWIQWEFIQFMQGLIPDTCCHVLWTWTSFGVISVVKLCSVEMGANDLMDRIDFDSRFRYTFFYGPVGSLYNFKSTL